MLMYVGILEVDLKCDYIYMLCLEYCPVGDHFGFQVGFLKQYLLWVGLYVYGWIVGLDI